MTLKFFILQLKTLVEKPNKPEENGQDDINGNTDHSVDDEEEWQVNELRCPRIALKVHVWNMLILLMILGY